MKALVRKKYGGPEVLHMAEMERPLPKANEVIVKVMATALNSWDWDQLVGKPRIYRLLFGLLVPKYKVLGCDVAGIVDEVGSNVTSFKKGDHVVGDISHVWGGLAEYVCADEKSFFQKPGNLNWEETAAVPQAAVLAYQALFDPGIPKEGSSLLINGAGGGVGTFALQYAKRLGLVVTCVDKADKFQKLRALGGDYFIDYRSEDFTTSGKSYDLIIDVIAQHKPSRYIACLNPGGTLSMIGGKPKVLIQTALFSRRIFRKTGKRIAILVHERNKHFPQILKDMEERKIFACLDSVHDLDYGADGFSRLGKGEAIGKVVIRIA
jgi:NADPH:quinone reductase-like Zn-dependent oxidoreductase